MNLLFICFPKVLGRHVETLTRTSVLLSAQLRCAPIRSINHFQLQSGDEPDGSSLTSEVLTFVDNSEGVTEDCGYTSNPIASSMASKNTSLAKFLSRPTLIDSRTWATSDLIGYLGATIEPWHLFLSNAVIKQKLTNYAFLRAKLCVKVVINATPFHFGLLRVAYEPNVNATNTGDRRSMIRTNPVSNLPYIVPLSQLPGIWLHPADDSGGELSVPFFRHNNWLNLNVKEPAKTMGALYYYIAAILGVASTGGSPTLTIDTFAWMEDVELSASTAELTLQSKDEYDGVVSAPATAIARVAGKLTTVPVIGKFARATQIGASAIADVASMFGFTNTPVITDIPARIPMPGPCIASSEIGAQVQKLTLDPKQELSVDPTLHGVPSDDQMGISHIVSQTSALTVGGWSTTDAVGDVLFNADVSPQLFGLVNIDDATPVTVSRRVYHTPMSYVGMMFTHWRGDVVFDIEVICTKFHKGRLKIAWDPLGSGGSSALPENTVYTTILDVGKNNKATFRVPYHQAFGWLRTRGISRENWSPGNPLPVNSAYDNGLFVVSVLTPLMSPVTPQNVSILFSVRGAGNLEYANLRSHLGESSASPPPTIFAIQAKDVVDIEPGQESFGDVGDQHPNRYALNFGECVASLRAVLHRMSIYDVSAPFAQSSTRFSTYGKSYSRLPPMYGFDPAGLSSANKLLSAGAANFNFCPTHPITYVAIMYGAFRGGVNYTANVSADLYPYVGDIRVQRITDTAYAANRRGRTISNQNAGVNSSVTTRYMNGFLANGMGGAAFTNSQTNGSVSWNQPMLTGTNFNYTDPAFAIAGNSADQSDLECSHMEILFKQSTASTVTEIATITTYCGGGVDLTCIWWLCCPTLDYYVSNPTTS